MKYLKLFESYNENILPDKPDCYQRIDYIEYNRLLGWKYHDEGDTSIRELEVNPKWVEKLSDLGYEASHYANGEPIPEWNKEWRHRYKSIFIKYKGDKYSYSHGIRYCNHVRVYEIPDDYFILEIDDRYQNRLGGDYHRYKCDQFKGLLECLKDNQIHPTR
jgi:hypothetical protein